MSNMPNDRLEACLMAAAEGETEIVAVAVVADAAELIETLACANCVGECKVF